MKKGLKTMLVVSSCMLAMSTNVCAAEPVDGQIIDGSMLTHETQSTVSEIFDWNFESMDEIAPFGSYYALGSCGISKESSNSVYFTATTECYEKCPTVKVEVTLQKLKNSTWTYVTSRSKTESNSYDATVEDTIRVDSGYYYRVVSFHSATKNGKTETGSATGRSIYVG
ncbi:MAG: DUF6147 family protein [Hominisplanchenecus sp.]|nr:DUF6147 family protein [Hominisplanchenecus sp.]